MIIKEENCPCAVLQSDKEKRCRGKAVHHACELYSNLLWNNDTVLYADGTARMDPVCTGKLDPWYRCDAFIKRGRKAVKSVLLFFVFGYKNAVQYEMSWRQKSGESVP